MEEDILIEKYLKGQLGKSEIEAFENRLKTDASFKKSLELEEQLFKTLSDDSWYFVNKKEADIEEYKNVLASDDIQALEKTLAKVNASHGRKAKNLIRPVFYYIAAASIALFFLLQFFFFQPPSPDALYAEYIALDELPSFVNRAEEESQLAKAETLFEQKEFEKALQLFEEAKGSNNEGLLLIYKGLAETEMKSFVAAEATFDKLIRSDLLDAEKGYWYKSLLLVKSGEMEEAKLILGEIIAESYYNHSKATLLLEDLE